MNETTKSYDPAYIIATKINATTIPYNITGLHPFLNFTFTAYIMDIYNNTKNKDSIIFCKLIVMHNESLSL